MMSQTILKFFYPLFCLFLFSGPAVAEQDLRALILELSSQIKLLQNQVSQANARIEQLEQARLAENPQKSETVPIIGANPAITVQAASLTGNAEHADKPAVTAGDIKGTIKIPGSDTSIGIGGFVKLDTLYSSVSTGNDKFGNQRLEVSEIPVGNIPAGGNDQFSIHAKESRFWFKSFTPSRWGDINTYLELDFYGDSGAYTYTPRLRHAYGSLGNFMAGQTWSTFFNSLALADTLDNSNSVGAGFPLRQPQIRWTQPFQLAKQQLDWQISLEAPRTRVWNQSTNGISTASTSHYPDLVGRINYHPNWGNISLSGLGRHLQFTPAALNIEQSAWAGAVSLAGKINTWGPDNLRFMLNYGDAMGRYAVSNVFADASIDVTGNLVPLISYGGMLAYQHWWDSTWRSTLVYGYARADQPGYASTANQKTQSLHANLLWSPIIQTTIGLEYIYADRELVNQQTGDLHHIQFSTRFNF